MGFKFSSEAGVWGLFSSLRPEVGFSSARTMLFVDNQWAALLENATVRTLHKKSGEQSIIEGKLDNGLQVRMRFNLPDRLAGCILDLELKNTSGRDMVLGSLHLMETTGGVNLGRNAGGLKVFIDSGGGWWAGAVDIASSSPYKEQWDLLPREDQDRVRQITGRELGPGFHNAVGGVSALYHPEGGAGLTVGFLTFNRACGQVTWLYQKGKGLVGGWAGCNYAGFHLKPGQTIRSEKLFLGFCEDPLDGLEEYADLAAKAMKVKLPNQPPMGWCSWYAYRLKVTEDIVLANARAIKDRFGGYDFSYIQVDHGWQYKNSCGHWTETNERFPHGLKWLSTQLEKMGYKLGLWLGFFCVLESSPLFKTHPEYMIRDEQGNPLAMPYQWAWEPHDRVYYLDPTHPGARKFIRDSFSTLRKAGVRYWKIDFTWGIADNSPNMNYHDAGLVKGAETYRAGTSLVRKVLKNDFLYWCSNPINLGYGLSQTSMTACDIGNTGLRQEKNVEGRIEGLDLFRRNATTTISRYYLHKRLILLNPDVVEVGGKGDIEEAKVRVSLVALAGGQVFLGDDLTTLTDEQWDLLAKCVPPYGRVARPVDLFVHTYPNSYPQIWHLPVRTSWGEWDLVGLFNLTDKKSQVRVDFSALKLETEKSYLVFEFWNKEFLGERKNVVSVDLNPISTKLLLIKKTPDCPIVLSTDMHFTQGGVELTGVHYRKSTKTLSGTARRQTGEQGRLFLWVPKGLAIDRSSESVAGDGELITLPLHFKKPAVKWRVKFKKNDNSKP